MPISDAEKEFRSAIAQMRVRQTEVRRIYESVIFDILSMSFDNFSVVILSEALRPEVQAHLQESRWVPSGDADWYYRLDPANPQMGILKHVHVARRPHLNSRPQYSWNDNETRHDAHKFNAHVPMAAKKIAARILGVDPRLLETLSIDSSEVLLELRE